MIGPDIDCAQSIPSMAADFANRLLYNCALLFVKPHGAVLELLTLRSLESWPWWNAQHSCRHPRTSAIRSAFVTVQPCPVQLKVIKYPSGNSLSSKSLIEV